ncbi:MAG: TetR/AcrR family transcriptional regulator [Solirubrobacteraceae bacterium]
MSGRSPDELSDASASPGSREAAAACRCLWARIEDVGSLPQAPIYPQLRAHRRGISREQVIEHQRARIHGAMIASVASRGWEGSTIAGIARLAGVSTRTVYERFGSKEGCLHATCDEVARQARTKVALSYDAARDGDGEPVAVALHAFAESIARNRRSASFVLLHAPVAGAEAYRRVARAHSLCAEALLMRVERDGEFKPSRVLLLGAVHGVSHVARMCVLDGRAEAAAEQLPALREWLLDAASPETEAIRFASEGSRAPPIGRAGTGRGGGPRLRAQVEPTAPTRGVVVGDRRARERLLRIAAEIAAREGYRAVSVARICDVAEISLEDFFAVFSSPEDCLLAARELLSAEALASALAAVEHRPRTVDGWCEALCRALAALLARIARDPALQSVGFLEPIGADGVRRRAAIMSRFGEILTNRAASLQRLDDSARHGGAPIAALRPPLSDAVVGAFWGNVQEMVLHGQAASLPSLTTPLAYLILCPILGAERALAAALRWDRLAHG